MIALLIAAASLGANVDALMQRAEWLAGQQEWSAAVDNADEAVRLDHNNPYRFVHRAVLARRAGLFYLDEAAGLDADNRDASLEKAREYFSSAISDLNRAEAQFNRQGVRSSLPDIWRGLIYHSLGERGLRDTDVAAIVDESNRRSEEADSQPPAQAVQTLKSALDKALPAAENSTSARDNLSRAVQHYSIAVGRAPQWAPAAARREAARSALEEVSNNSEPLNEAITSLQDKLRLKESLLEIEQSRETPPAEEPAPPMP